MSGMQLYNEWLVYHANNPHIYRLVCRFADEAMRAGHSRFGIGAIWERVRWEVAMTTNDENFKMPNNHRAYYARHWLRHHPDNAGFFRISELRSQRPDLDFDRYGQTI